MTNYEKMLELTGAKATKAEIKTWAYMNRIYLIELAYGEPFQTMKSSVKTFTKDGYSWEEEENWDRFLDCEYVEGVSK